MYQVIARKYRPQSFEDVVNQDHVKQTLINALHQSRVGHGYIFSGPRGTGKTTMARILAKALNCEQGPGPIPCQQCSSCLEIAAGNAMDVMEIDAASNRRIDDIRELRENVRYRPARDRYKVFIIDEAHQITSDAFNALLKTLEEPPEWVVFVLCTTEPQDFPATIVSRCQSFPFRTVELDQVVGRLELICKQEGIASDTDALVAIALSGDGSIRDSLSTLDQAIACFGKKLEAAAVRELLGAIPAEITEQLTEAVHGRDAGQMLALVDRLSREGRHLQHFCGELTRYFRNLLVMKVSGADTRLVTAGTEERKRLATWIERFSQEDLTRYLNLLLDLYRELQHASQPRFRMEIGLLKLVYAGHLQPLEKVLAEWGGGGAATAPPATPSPATTGAGSRGARSASGVTEPAAKALAAAAAGGRGARVGFREGGPAAEASAPSTRAVSELEHSRSAPPEPMPAAVPAGEPRAAAAAPAAGGGAELGARLASALRQRGDESVADAVEHGVVTAEGGRVEIRSLADYRATLEFSLDLLTETLGQVMGQTARVRLGANLAETEGIANGADPAGSASAGQSARGSGARTETPNLETDVVQRALADPEVQKIRKLFEGQVREVRNLREYSS